jgi:hypothetical protein
MIRNLLAGATALTLITAGAYAQDSTYYSNTRTVTQTSPFGSSRTVTTTTSEPPQADYDGANAVADLPPPPESPPPDYARTTTTTEYGPNGLETRRTTTTTRTDSFTYGAAPVYRPNAAAVGPSPNIDMPPSYRQTVITHMTTGDETDE